MGEDENLLARIDERVKSMQEELHRFVTRHEFQPVKLITYGLAGLVLSTVLATVIARVIH